MKVYRPSWCE